MVVVWIVLGLAAWTALSVAAGVVIGRFLAAGGEPPQPADAAEAQEGDHAEAA